jgi:hypothetical protein
LNKEFSKEEVQMANKYMKKCSTPVIKEMQTKIALRFHLTPVRMAIIKKTYNNIGEDLVKQESLYTVGGHAN